VTVCATPASAGTTAHPLPDGTLEGSHGLPRVSERVASAPRVWLRSLPTRRGSTRSRASARVQVKLVTTVFVFASSFVTSHRVEPKLRPTFGAALTSESRASGFAIVRACPSDDEDSVRTPSGVLSGTGNAADRFEPSGGFAPQIRPKLFSIRESSTSRCGNTLEWHPRAREVERLLCLHRERSVRRSKNLMADS
jgi:hypothetical protein